jgi:tRNA(His) 5'-end guanylyltransferase
VIYTKFNPHLIYTFQNEINVVFFYNERGTFIYNGDINKIVTNIVSVVSIEVYKRLSIIQPNVDLNFHGHFVEFDIDYEVLNYLVWRQMDCKRNTITLLYRCYNEIIHDDTNIKGIKIINMISVLNHKIGKDITREYMHLLTGNIIKKCLFYKIKNEKGEDHDNDEKDDNVIIRRSIGIENIYFSDNFKTVLRKYIINKIN